MLASTALLLLLGALVPALAAAVQITGDVQQNIAPRQVTFGWRTDSDATSELRWDDKRHDNYADYPAEHDESYVDPSLDTAEPTLAGKIHSRTISYLPNGRYWVMVRSRDAAGNYATKGPFEILLEDKDGEESNGSGSLARLLINGPVTASTTAAGDTGAVTYIAGDFTSVGLRTGSGVTASMSSDVTRRGDVPRGLPEIEGTSANDPSKGAVLVSTSDGNGGWYIGGRFSKIGGLPRRGLAHILPDGGVDPYFSPGSGVGAYRAQQGEDEETEDGVVYALSFDEVNFKANGLRRLYVGGNFDQYDGRVEHNILAVNADTGVKDASFVTKHPQTGVIGTDRSVHVILADPDEPDKASIIDKYDHSGVYFGGAFTTFRGEEYARIAHTEMNGDRAYYRVQIRTDDSPEWNLIRQIAGPEAAIQDGHFEITPDVFIKSQNPDGTNKVYDPDAVVTSLAIYDQRRCATGVTIPARPNSFLKDIPLIGFLFNLTALMSAMADQNSPDHKYMAAFMRDRIIKEAYRPTLIAGGRFHSATRPLYRRDANGWIILKPNPAADPSKPETKMIPAYVETPGKKQNGLVGIASNTGTFQVATSNPQMATLEGIFPSLGQEIRNDPGQTNGRFMDARIQPGGEITSLAVVDRHSANAQAECASDALYIGGNFRTEEVRKAGATKDSDIRDLAKIDLSAGVITPWKIDPDYRNGAVDSDDVEDKATFITSLQLDDPTNPTTVFAAGRFGQSAGKPRAGFAMYPTNATGVELTQPLRDGADGVVNTITVNKKGASVRAFIGGDFKSYDAFAAPGVAGIKAESDDPYAKIDVDQNFRPTAPAAGGDITDISATAKSVFIGGTFTRVGGQARGKLASYRRTPESAIVPGGRLSTVGGGANGGVDGRVNALQSYNGRVFVGGAFNKYVSPTGAVCNCGNIAVVGDDGELISAGATGYLYESLGVDGPVNALAIGNGRIYVGGSFHHGGGLYGERGGLLVANVDDGHVDTEFHAKDGGTNGSINALAVAAGGAVFIGGSFTTYRDVPVSNLAKLTGAGTLDGYFHDPEYGTKGANGEISALQLINGQLFAAGTFTQFDGADRNGVAGMSTVTGDVSAWDPKVNGAVDALTTVGDRLVIGGDFTGIDGRDGHGNVGIVSETVRDELKPYVRMTQTGGLPSKGTYSAANGDVFYGPRSAVAEDPQDLVLSLVTYDRATFAQLAAKTPGQAVRQIAWPFQVGGASRIGAEQPSGAGVEASCTVPSANGATAPTEHTAKAMLINGAASFPASMVGTNGAAQCRWTSNLIVPNDAGGTLQMRVTGAGGARAWIGTADTPGEEVLDKYAVATGDRPFTVQTGGRDILPLTVDWTGSVPNGSFRLEWRDPNGVWGIVPAAAYAGTIAYSARYRFEAGAKGDVRVGVSVNDGPNAQEDFIQLRYDDDLPVGADLSAANLPASGISATPIRLSVGADKGDGSGSDVAGRWLEMQEAPFAATAPYCAGIDPGGTWTKLDPRVLTPNDFELADQGERCYSYRLATRDNVDNVRYDYIGGAGPQTVAYDKGAPTIGMTAVAAPLEGTNATLTGPLADSGVGVASYKVTVAGQSSVDLTGCTVTASDWTCPFDTSLAADGTYSVGVWAKDWFEQETAPQPTMPIRVDNEGPVAAPASVDLGAAGASAQPNVAVDSAAGATPVVWYNPNLPGSFTVSTSFTDDGSGLMPVAPLDLGAKWTSGAGAPGAAQLRSAAKALSGSGVAGSPTPVSQTFNWAEGADAPGVQTFTAFETFGKQNSVSFDVRKDGDDPTIVLEDGKVDGKSIAVPVAMDDATTAVVNAGYVRRIGAMVKPGTCDGAKWSDPSPVVTLTPDATVVTDTDLKAGQCYRYAVTAVDRVGNQPDVAEISNQIRVGDIDAPKEPSKVVAPVATVPVPATPQPTVQPPVLRDKEIADKPAATAPVPKPKPKPVVIEQAKPKVAAPAPRVIRVEVPKPVAKPKPVVAKPAPVVEEQRTASTPKPKAKADDRSWFDKSIDWTKDHKLEAAAVGAAGAHLGGTLLFGKGLFGMLSHLFNQMHLNVPFGVVRRLLLQLWTRRRKRDDEDDDADDDLDAGDDDRWGDVPSTYRPAA